MGGWVGGVGGWVGGWWVGGNEQSAAFLRPPAQFVLRAAIYISHCTA